MRVLLICELKLLLCHSTCEWQNFKYDNLFYGLNYFFMAVKVPVFKVLLTL